MENLNEGGAPADLSHAGAIVDKAIEYMISQQVSSIAIASALLGGALGMLTRTLSDEAVVGILSNAVESVRSGELRQQQAPPERH
jgi:hypothetical protein